MKCGEVGGWLKNSVGEWSRFERYYTLQRDNERQLGETRPVKETIQREMGVLH